jgi:hypothetical protein
VEDIRGIPFWGPFCQGNGWYCGISYPDQFTRGG